MRALVVAPQPFFTFRGTPFSVYYRTLSLAEMGVDVDLLTYGRGADVDLPDVRVHRIPRFSFLGPVRIGPSWLKFFFDLLLFVRLFRMLLGRRYDFVHAHEEGVFFALLLKPIFRFKLVYDMHSSLPHQLLNFRFTRSRILVALFAWFERRSLRRSEAVLVICPDLEALARREGVDDERLFLIENSVYDEVRLRGAPPSDDVPPIPTDGPLVMYVGTFEAYQGLETLVRAFPRVLRAVPNARLALIGGEPDQVAALARLAAEDGAAERVTIHGRVSQRAAHRALDAATVVVSPRTGGTNTPLKVYEILGRGLPLVATRILSHTQVLTDECSVLVEPTPEGLAGGIIRLLREPETRTLLAESGRALYASRYSREAYDEKMKALLRVLR